MAVLETVASLWPGWPLLGLTVLFYVVGIYTYRLTLHPLAKFPGPKLAALSLWYEFYWDAIHRGQYIFRVWEMHEKYGPVVRIAPNELHINDPDFLPEVFPVGGRRRDKYRRTMQLFGFTEAAISTVEHDVHRIRRGAMAKMFSKDSVRRLEPIMQSNLEKLFVRLQECKANGKPVNVLPVYSAFTNDLITEYAFGISYNWLEAKEFNKDFFDFITSFHEMGAMAVQFSWFMSLINSLPDSITKAINPGYVAFLEFKRGLEKQIEGVVQRHQEGKDNKTVFDEILDSNLPASEKRPERLLEESQNIAIAGTETTAWTLSVITYHLLCNADILRKVKDELKNALPDPTSMIQLKQVEQLPYLTALISEGLRLGMGTSNRQTRVAPDEALILNSHFNGQNKEWRIPAGTPVAMTTPLIHLNPSIFPDPLKFRPERFLENPKLKRYILSFSQGSRQCLGMQLAYGELYLVLAGVWRRFGGPGNEGEDGYFELFETDKEDVEMRYDLFVPYGKRDSKGIRVIVK